MKGKCVANKNNAAAQNNKFCNYIFIVITSHNCFVKKIKTSDTSDSI